MGSFLRFLFLLGFVSVTGVIFIALSVMLGKYELIMLVAVILIGAFIRPLLEKRKHILSGIPIVGESIEIYDDLEKYYKSNKPHAIFYYVLYPLSGLFSYFWNAGQAKKELCIYFNLIKWILLLLIFEGFASYFRIYRYFDASFAYQWFYLELLIVYFLCNFFAIPVAVVTLKLHIQKNSKQFVFLLLWCFTIFGFSLYHFLVTAKYDNLLTINVVLDRNISDEKSNFRRDLYEQTNMFLEHHVKGMSAYYYENLFSFKNKLEYLQNLNAKYQEQLAGFCSFGENEHFFITTTYEWQEIWGIVNLPFRDSIVYFFCYKDNHLSVYDTWQAIPVNKRDVLKNKWNQEMFELSTTKVFARTMVDNFREKMKATENDFKKQEKSKDVMQDKNASNELTINYDYNLQEKYSFLKGRYEEEWFLIQEVWTNFIITLKKKFGLDFPREIAMQDQFISNWLPTWKLDGYEDIKGKVVNFNNQQKQNIPTKTEEILQEFLQRDTELVQKKMREQLIVFENFINTVNEFKSFISHIDNFINESFQKHSISNFAVYDQNLIEFDYEKAFQQKLVNDHSGKSPEIRKNFVMMIYGYLFYFLIKLFEFSMPIHIFLICYSRFQNKN